MLVYLNQNSDVWLGWAYWAAGPWWGNYRFSIEPSNGVDRPQTDVLQEAIPIPQPQLTLRRVPQLNDVAATYATRYGFKYQPQASFSLESGSWASFGNSITGTAQSFNILMRTSSNAHRFFRLQIDRLP
jgi:hypothetical protein